MHIALPTAVMAMGDFPRWSIAQHHGTYSHVQPPLYNNCLAIGIENLGFSSLCVCQPSMDAFISPFCFLFSLIIAGYHHGILLIVLFLLSEHQQQSTPTTSCGADHHMDSDIYLLTAQDADTPFLSRDSSPSARTHATPWCFNALSLLLACCIASLPPSVRDCLFCQSGPASKHQAGQVPIIRTPRGNMAEMIAKKVEMKIRDSIITASCSQGSSSLFSQEPSGLSTLQRPHQCASQLLHMYIAV